MKKNIRLNKKTIFTVFIIIILFIYISSLSFLVSYLNTNKEQTIETNNTTANNEKLSLLSSLSVDETVNITAETAGSISGSSYRVSLSGNIYYATTSTGERSNKWVVLIHGYMMSGSSIANAIGQIYLDQGYNILAPDLRGAGSSGGSTAMGYVESLDIWDWLTFLNTNYSVNEIIVHGVSLGGATTLQLWSQKDQGRDLTTQNVVGLVDDCGYTSMTSIMEGLLATPEGIEKLAEILNLPQPQSLYSLIGEDNIRSFLINIIKVGLTESNFSKNQDAFSSGREFSDVPILVIHGTSDTTVPYSNSLTVIEEANNRGLDATLWSVENQPHAFIVVGLKTNEYKSHVVEFLSKISKNSSDIIVTEETDSILTQIAQNIDNIFQNVINTIKQLFSK